MSAIQVFHAGETFEVQVDADLLPEVLRLGELYLHGNQYGNHRAILKRTHGPMLFLHRMLAAAGPAEVVFARNGDYLDCRFNNLLILPRAEAYEVISRKVAEKIYRRGRGHPSHGEPAPTTFKGVTWRRNRGRDYIQWAAQIHLNNRTLHLGIFPFTPEGERAAARAFDMGVLEHRPAGAYLNFPEQLSQEIQIQG